MLSLSFREQLPPIVAAELDSLLTRLQRVLDTNKPTSSTSVDLTGLTARVAATEAVNATQEAEISALSGTVGGKAPANAKYIVQTADATLTAEQALGALATGILKSTTTTGVVSIAAATDIPFAADTPGLKHKRVTTGVVAAGAEALITVTWGTAFADANYTVVASVLDATTSVLSMSVVHIDSMLAASCAVRVINTSAGNITGTIHAIAIKD